MKQDATEVLVIGGGAAGMAAATAAACAGARTLLLERNDEPGGVLNQCIHPGFGLHRYREELTGPEFAHRMLRELNRSRARVVPRCSVLDIVPQGPLVRAVSPEGVMQIRPQAVVWATGARERPFGSLIAPGPRPAGIYSAGLAQRFVNIHGFLPGRRALILGSGDIGLIMARRLHLEGTKVVAVVELKPFPGGLTRNVVQCLEDYDIPLLLSHTITEIHGSDRLAGVTLARVDGAGRPIPGTEEDIEVDTLILSVGLIPENELILPLVSLDPLNRGPRLDSRMQTETPWLFAAGNNVVIFDLVDSVAAVGEEAGRFAARYARGDLPPSYPIPLVRGENVLHLAPTALDPETPTTLYLRVSRPMRQAEIKVGKALSRKQMGVRPSEMIEIRISSEALRELQKAPEVRVEVREA
jgi:thioredoxin reductase